MALPAQAAPSVYWSNYYEPYFWPSRQTAPRLRNPIKHRLPKQEAVAKEARKPQGPLILAISIDKQVLTVYDANGAFAVTPISTGMRAHPTPMGVFSVIQKQKYHRSNIYSGAPMPYMQRITWSGVAMHAGVLPGYPASHGCIRMPMNFAVKMWGWTRMGARVLIVPGELSPQGFSHPLLATRRTAPLAEAKPDTTVWLAATAKSDKAAVLNQAMAPGLPEAIFELKSTLGHDVTGAAATTQTADAGSTVSRSESTPSIVDVPAGDAVLDVKKDQTRAPGADPAPKPDTAAAPKRGGQLAVFISKKDSRLYVRQNFAPLFDVPITISQSDRPLGTHVFTAQTDKDDANLVHWSAISMPSSPRHGQNDDARSSQRRDDTAGAVELAPAPLADSPAEALDRLTIPADSLARINEALSTGSSIIVSDQGVNSGETGIGTDFIIPLR